MDDGACETVNSGDRVCQSINCDHKPAAHINMCAGRAVR